MSWKRPAKLREKVLPMKVLNLGMSRTGTTSMCTALEMLGCKACYHLDYDSDDCAFWLAAMEAKYEGKDLPFGKKEWDHIFAQYDVSTSIITAYVQQQYSYVRSLIQQKAISDLPAILFGPELAAAYPEAKILLTVRDVDSWHRSMLTTVCNPVYQGWYHRFPALFFAREKALCEMSDKCERITWQNDCRKFGKQFYLGYNDEVRQLASDEPDRPLSQRRFLEWELGEGWSRLAPFLGCDVPQQSYPSGNNVVEFQREADLHARSMWIEVGQKLATWSVVAASGLTSMWWFRTRYWKKE